MFWSKKKPTDEASSSTAPHDVRPGAKGRPTPKRRESEAANRRPLVVTDRKLARDSDKVRRKEAVALQRQAMVTGDDAHLPKRDKGPERRYIRDYIDARWSVGELMLPIMLIVLALSMLGQRWQLLVFFLVYGLVLVAIIDAFFMWRRIKAKLAAKFGPGKVPPGGLMYAMMRSFQIRPTRMPKPQVKRGAFPT